MATSDTQRPGYMSASQAAAYMGISRALFFELVRDYANTSGRAGVGPVVYWTPRTPRWSIQAIDRCAKRYQRQHEFVATKSETGD